MHTEVSVAYILSSKGFAACSTSERFRVQVNSTYVCSPLARLDERLITEVTGIGLSSSVDVHVSIAIVLCLKSFPTVCVVVEEIAYS